MEKAATFASETENRTSARIPDDKLDEAFEHLEIPDIPLEYEDEDDDYIDEEVPLGAGRRYASGASFEELDAAMRTARDPSADDNQRRQAGRLFGQMPGHGVLRPPRERLLRHRGKDNGIDGLLFKPALPDGWERRGCGSPPRLSPPTRRTALPGSTFGILFND